MIKSQTNKCFEFFDLLNEMYTHAAWPLPVIKANMCAPRTWVTRHCQPTKKIKSRHGNALKGLIGTERWIKSEKNVCCVRRELKITEKNEREVREGGEGEWWKHQFSNLAWNPLLFWLKNIRLLAIALSFCSIALAHCPNIVRKKSHSHSEWQRTRKALTIRQSTKMNA